MVFTFPFFFLVNLKQFKIFSIPLIIINATKSFYKFVIVIFIFNH